MDRKTQIQILWAAIVSLLLLLVLALNPVQANEENDTSEKFQIYLPWVADQSDFEPTRWDDHYDCSTNPLQQCGFMETWRSCGTEFCGGALTFEVDSENCLTGVIDPTNSRIKETRNGQWVSFIDYGRIGQTVLQDQHLYSWGAEADFTYAFVDFQRPGTTWGLQLNEIHFVWNCQPTS